ncbi:MAG TPA: sugar ABC transporter permease [Tepidisphaeraceae bacterium]|jgi:multiple sugar transport system permease protein|nr:sugar ABC transporter permease [Tepidisphaeraceae bacterium]
MPSLSRARSVESKNLLKGLAFVSPWIIGFVAFTAVPVALSLYYSFCDYPMLQKPTFIGLANYRELWNDPIFWQVLRNTFIYAALALPLGMVIALGVAILLNTKIRGQFIYRTIIFLPSLVPAVASAMLWLWLFNAKLGLINVALRAVGVDNPPGWLSDITWAMPALVLMSFWGIGNTVIIYLAGLQDVPRELYEAAELDGANSFRQVWHVTLPSISPVIFFNLVMAIIGTLQVFGTPYIMTGGGPARSTYFYTMYLYDSAFRDLKMGYASALAWVQLLIVLILTAIAAWTSKHWVHYQGK